MKILVPIDGSEFSKAAVREVASQPWPAGTKVRLLYALELYPRGLHGAGVLPPDRYEDLENLDRSRSRNFLDDAVSALKEAGFREEDISTCVTIGTAKRVILDEAEQWNSDLIVVGSHGDGAIKRFLLGSVSLAVAMHAPCSVMVVKIREEEDE